MAQLIARAVRAGRGRWLALILLATVALPVGMDQHSPFARARTGLFDFYQIALPRARLSHSVTIVAIDEAALKAIGQWPWPRSYLADLIERIGAQGALVIGLNLVMPERDQTSPDSLAERIGPGQEAVRDALSAMPAYDVLLSQTLQRYPVVLGAVGFTVAAPGTAATLRTWPVVTPKADIMQRVRRYPYVLTSLPQFQSAASGQALLISASPESGVVRRVEMISAVGTNLVPAFALELLRVARNAGIEVEASGGAVTAVSVGGLRVPTQPAGDVWLHFGASTPDRYVSASDVLDRRTKSSTFKDKLVIIALTGQGAIDHKTTPRGEHVPEAEVHAQMIESVFDGRILHRPVWMSWTEVVILIALGGMLIWVAPRLRRDPAILLAIGLLFLVLALGFGLFHWYGLLFDAVSLVVALTTVFSSLIAIALVRADDVRRATENSLQVARESSARVAGELEAARRIQLGILPQAKSSFPGEQRFDLAAAIESARAVGGDLYDFFMLDADRLFVIIGDVSGKGIPASLLMSITKALTKSIALGPGDDASQVLTRANVEVSRDNPESQFVTAFAAVLDVHSGVLRYWTAGHDTPFLVDRNGARQIDRALSGPPLCVLEEFDYREQSISLAVGDSLVLFTDGVTEAEDSNGKQFGKARLARCLETLPKNTSANDMLDAIRAEVSAFVAGAPASDDLTLLVVRWLGSPEQAKAP